MKCRYCERELPDKSFITKDGCRWCSPIPKVKGWKDLPKGKFTFAFDMDATISECMRIEDGESMLYAKPKTIGENSEVLWIDIIKELKNRGHWIVIFTRRGGYPHGREYTEKWLDKYEVPYDDLIADKPHFDLLIDDRAMAVWNRTTWSPEMLEVFAKSAHQRMLNCRCSKRRKSRGIRKNKS